MNSQFRSDSSGPGAGPIRTLTTLDSGHPTVVEVVFRDDDHSAERTDARPSEAYRAHSLGDALDDVAPLVFHEGAPPAAGLNGWLLEDLIAVCLDRARQHQAGPFACRENALVVTKLEEALLWTHARRRARQVAGTSGTQTL